jgi:hypothetical protein
VSVLALELNDAGLILARRDEAGETVLLAESPGFALLEGAGVVTGAEAAARVRQRPLFAHSTFWREIGTAPLPRPAPGLETTADVAFAHLDELLRPHRTAGDRLIVAVPAGYAREQLGILIGVVNETGVPLAGLVDAGLAASALEPATRRVLHLEIELHRAVLTVLELQGESQGLKRTHSEQQLRLGWLSFQQAWIERVAETFVRKTRFDPLHKAATEQLLVDLLPGWLAALKEQETVSARIEFAGEAHEVELSRTQMVDAVAAKYAELVRLVQAVRPAGEALTLCVSQRIAELPGALEQIATLRDCAIRIVPRGAAAQGALLHAAAIERTPDSLTLVYRLPVDAAAGEAAVNTSELVLPPEQQPTHVLFAGRAWPLSATPLRLGWEVREGRRLTVPAGVPGVSRLHCTLVRRDGITTVEDHSTYGSYVNDERVRGKAMLKVGDRLRLGAPGVQLDLIQIVNEPA